MTFFYSGLASAMAEGPAPGEGGATEASWADDLDDEVLFAIGLSSARFGDPLAPPKTTTPKATQDKPPTVAAKPPVSLNKGLGPTPSKSSSTGLFSLPHPVAGGSAGRGVGQPRDNTPSSDAGDFESVGGKRKKGKKSQKSTTGASNASGSGPRNGQRNGDTATKAGQPLSVFLTANVMVENHSVSRLDMVRGVEKLVEIRHVEAVVKQPKTWMIMFREQDRFDDFMSHGHVRVAGREYRLMRVAEEGPGGKIQWIRPNKMVKIHWLPPFVPDEVVKEALEMYGVKVTGITREKGLTDPTDNGVRRAWFLSNEEDPLPHIGNLYFGGDRMSILLTVPGRLPMCLKCKQVGHVRGACTSDRVGGLTYAARLAAHRDLEDRDDPAEEGVEEVEGEGGKKGPTKTPPGFSAIPVPIPRVTKAQVIAPVATPNKVSVTTMAHPPKTTTPHKAPVTTPTVAPVKTLTPVKEAPKVAPSVTQVTADSTLAAVPAPAPAPSLAPPVAKVVEGKKGKDGQEEKEGEAKKRAVAGAAGGRVMGDKDGGNETDGMDVEAEEREGEKPEPEPKPRTRGRSKRPATPSPRRTGAKPHVPAATMPGPPLHPGGGGAKVKVKRRKGGEEGDEAAAV